MKYQCKITVLETKVFPELQEKYLADPKSSHVHVLRQETNLSLTEYLRRMISII